MKSQNKTKEYISELNDYLKMFQADHEAWLELCDVYLYEMEYTKAAFCLEELILMHPHNHVYNQRYADVFLLIKYLTNSHLIKLFFSRSSILKAILKLQEHTIHTH